MSITPGKISGTTGATLTNGKAVILTLGLVSAMGSMAIHMLAPALPLLQHDLSTNVVSAQLVISIYLAGLGIGQLIAGPLVDRLGRRRLLFAGLLLFIIGSTSSFFAPDLNSLLLARFLQATGGAAGLLTSRVLVADLFDKKDGAGMQATLMMVVLISPALAPVIGGFLASAGGWRMVPALLAFIALGAFLLSWKFLPSGEICHRQMTGPRDTLMMDARRLFSNRAFLLATIALSTASGALYMFLTSGAFIIEHQFGLDEKATGICFLLVALASILGTRLVRRIERRCNTLLAGCGFILFGSTLALICALAGVPGPVALIGPVMLLGLGAGIAGPAAINIAVNAEYGLAGTGASLAGGSQMLVSGAATVPLGWFVPITSLKLALALTISSLVAFAAAWSGSKISKPHDESPRMENGK